MEGGTVTQESNGFANINPDQNLVGTTDGEPLIRRTQGHAASPTNASGSIRTGTWQRLMRGLAIMAVAFLAALTSVVPHSEADPLPNGSYLQSCRGSRTQGDVLFAQCQTSHLLGSQWKDTSLAAVSGCVGDIFNVEGRLQCNRDIALPDGSYRRTCRSIYAEKISQQSWLFASCKLSNADEWVPWFLPDFTACRGDIFNFEGFIACNKGQLPPGGYLRSCSEMFISGSILGGHCRTRSGDFKKTTLKNVQTCRTGSIENLDGNLACAR